MDSVATEAEVFLVESLKGVPNIIDALFILGLRNKISQQLELSPMDRVNLGKVARQSLHLLNPNAAFTARCYIAVHGAA